MFSFDEAAVLTRDVAGTAGDGNDNYRSGLVGLLGRPNVGKVRSSMQCAVTRCRSSQTNLKQLAIG